MKCGGKIRTDLREECFREGNNKCKGPEAIGKNKLMMLKEQESQYS